MCKFVASLTLALATLGLSTSDALAGCGTGGYGGPRVCSTYRPVHSPGYGVHRTSHYGSPSFTCYFDVEYYECHCGTWKVFKRSHSKHEADCTARRLSKLGYRVRVRTIHYRG